MQPLLVSEVVATVAEQPAWEATAGGKAAEVRAVPAAAVRRHRPLHLPLGLLLAGCTALVACAAEADPATPGLPVPDQAQQATVVRVVDGDTVQLRGRGTGPLPARPTRVRLLLIDTPEIHTELECFGEAAAQRAEELLPEGTVVRVVADRDPIDRFGRALLHVWNDAGVNVGEALVREGFAEVLFLRPNDRYLSDFEAAEDSARSSGRGLWAACD